MTRSKQEKTDKTSTNLLFIPLAADGIMLSVTPSFLSLDEFTEFFSNLSGGNVFREIASVKSTIFRIRDCENHVCSRFNSV